MSKKIKGYLEELIYLCIIIPLIIITISVVMQSIFYKDKIPNILGFKMFMILNNCNGSFVKTGDLVFTKNIDTNTLESGDIVAFRNGANTVTIHKIIKTEEKEKK